MPLYNYTRLIIGCDRMKYIKVSLFICILFIPFMVEAKEYCKVVSGNGKDIGSEIACGTEHFYVLENKDDTIRMLAKYNLYTGSIIDRYEIQKEEGDTRTNKKYCQDLATEKGARLRDDTDYSRSMMQTPYYTTDKYCYLETTIETNSILQNKDAIGAHVDAEGNYLYPQVGDTYLSSGTNGDYKTIDESVVYEDDSFKDFTISLDNTGVISTTLNAYKNSLTGLNINVKNIDLLSLKDMNDIISKTANKTLPLVEWADNVRNLSMVNEGFVVGDIKYNIYGEFGSLKSYITSDYSWLYGTTYWMKTIFSSNNTFYGKYYLFTGSMGKLCSGGFSYCALTTHLGCGIRPVIIISTNELQYIIKTETDGNGEIEVVNNALGGEKIQFKITPNKGYKLKSIFITTDSGEEIEFSEGEITKNDDGTISIDKNKFTMPFENVTIEAKWIQDIVNPKTGSKILIIVLSIITSLGLGTYIYKKKESRYKI